MQKNDLEQMYLKLSNTIPPLHEKQLHHSSHTRTKCQPYFLSYQPQMSNAQRKDTMKPMVS